MTEITPVVPSVIRADVRSIRIDIMRAIKSLEKQRRNATAVNVATRVGCHRNTFDNHIRHLLRENFVGIEAGSGTRPATYFVTEVGEKILEVQNV